MTGEEGFVPAVRQLMEIMKRYFESAAGELREGVEWMLPEWIDLGVYDEIAASDVHITTKVIPPRPQVVRTDDRTGKRHYWSLLHYRNNIKVRIQGLPANDSLHLQIRDYFHRR